MPQFHKRDEVVTEQARISIYDRLKFNHIFLDPRSYVTTTGCVKLFGEDFSKQCAEVVKEHGNRCYRCSEWKPRNKLEVDHNKSRGQGGCDCKHNLRPLCGIGCHRGPKGKHP